jgi:hypothetical protein
MYVRDALDKEYSLLLYRKEAFKFIYFVYRAPVGDGSVMIKPLSK